MKRTSKLETILLIDDDEATNYLHKTIIEHHNKDLSTTIFQDARAALYFLKHEGDTLKKSIQRSVLIFLDVNMPHMDGWKFMQQFNKLDEAIKDNMVVIMASSQLDYDDKLQAGKIADVQEIIMKPVTTDVLEEIITKYFR